jgi:hypothetical protein
MTAPIAGLFGDAIRFIFVPRESVTGGVQVGGIGEASSWPSAPRTSAAPCRRWR